LSENDPAISNSLTRSLDPQTTLIEPSANLVREIFSTKVTSKLPRIKIATSNQGVAANATRILSKESTGGSYMKRRVKYFEVVIRVPVSVKTYNHCKNRSKEGRCLAYHDDPKRQ
jgi:hypothetical protein